MILFDKNNESYQISNEIYRLKEDADILTIQHFYPEIEIQNYKKGGLVRLIETSSRSGIMGYHPSKGWSTICRYNATYPEWFGIETHKIELINGFPEGFFDVVKLS